MPTTQEILDHFHTLTDDDTTLSQDEELVLANKAYRKILRAAPWEFLKSPYSAVQSASVPYVALPADFRRFVTEQGRTSLYVGDANSDLALVPASRSTHYANQSGFAYLDMRNARLVFTRQPLQADAVSGWYIYRPADLGPDDEPVFDEDYHYAIAHAMVSDYYISDQTPKGRTYYEENEAKFDELLQAMLMDNALLADNREAR